MYVCYAAGIIGSIAHHSFYAGLDGKEAHDQLKMLRFGSAFAYFAKASFVASVILAYRQQIWATFRRSQLKISTIDYMFAAADDLSAMFSLDFLKTAKVAIALAFLIW